MEQFAHISPQDTKKRLDENSIKVVDIRDEQSFASGRIPGAFHLTNGSIQQFINDNDFETPVVVCCYHGISSQQAAQYMLHQGFEEVYSMDGGFEAWRGNYEFESGEI
ncbi:thiosulfate sulfurtransferase GlpE [Glaciecola sp. KUL10]|uniref:thiosulfate sulfurtransferase GlpE n=1 Tax=Glaciecola sp. (strain KUL10) TaxID=2161813 RepID=UPI000D7888C7|nr:thiosulfate sulfurtransferase GlpE [Glaciecola sp. KUL10]GBL05732.1 thiosulfate sulfurtransferase GlpE [Glaciecola sp. KUL10]